MELIGENDPKKKKRERERETERESEKELEIVRNIVKDLIELKYEGEPIGHNPKSLRSH